MCAGEEGLLLLVLMPGDVGVVGWQSTVGISVGWAGCRWSWRGFAVGVTHLLSCGCGQGLAGQSHKALVGGGHKRHDMLQQLWGER